MRDDDFIVSKTDLSGKITYGNRIFIEFSGYEESELLGRQHNIIRHPDMPRCVFKLLWDTVSAGSEVFAYVKNQSRNGDYYWVFANVTPSFDATGQISSYYSVRRKPRREAIDKIMPVYRQLLALESNGTPKQGLADAEAFLQEFLATQEQSYNEFVLGL